MIYEDLFVHQVEEFLKNPDAIVIDARDLHSYKHSHIEGALHMGGPLMGELICGKNKSLPVLVYCYHGNMSKDVAHMIAGFGFNNVAHLVDGWHAWSEFVNKAKAEAEMGTDFDMLDAGLVGAA